MFSSGEIFTLTISWVQNYTAMMEIKLSKQMLRVPFPSRATLITAKDGAQMSIGALRFLFLFVLCFLFIPSSALAQNRVITENLVNIVRQQMEFRGDSNGDLDLALAWIYAKAHQTPLALQHLKQAKKQGISGSRTDLLLGTLYRLQGRYDNAFKIFVRVLVKHPGQPYAQVQLWKTLYEAKLQNAPFQTDTAPIREQFRDVGLFFPVNFDADKMSKEHSDQLTASAYNALLADKNNFAAELFESAIEAFPSNALAHRGLGIARARNQDYTRAAGAYLLYLELRPNAADAEEVDRVLMDYWKNRPSP